jgi:hypothetical protein
MIVQRNVVVGWCEYDRASNEIFFRRSGKFFFCRRAFCDCHVTSRLNKLFKLLIRHWRCIHPEAIHSNAVDRICII